MTGDLSMRMPKCCLAAAAMLLAACSGEQAASPVKTPGAEPTAKTRALEAGSAVLQTAAPVRALDVYLDGFHFYNHDLQSQVEAHHFCSVVDEDVRQCVIFDGNARSARIVGVEYVVSRRVFEQLPEDERKLWHSHVYEVKSGTLVAPGLPGLAEDELMEQLVDTYGKTWHTWHTHHGDELPLGHPLLMAGFTADGQADPALIAARDERMDVSSSARREARSSIAAPEIADGADAWERGEVLQLELKQTRAKAPPPEAKIEPDRDTGADPALPSRRLRPHRAPAIYAAVPRVDAVD
jgi:hypothetical protein